MKLKLITEINQNELIDVTTEWMSEKYDLMNRQLFGGKLGHCDFGIFTTGRGKNGGVLGWFMMTGKNLKYNRTSRRLFVQDPYWGDKEYVDYDNFVQLCKPRIELNGNYRWTEKAALSTLVHEMCHYYNHMYGWVPKQSHGIEFRDIAYVVSSRSKGIFTVERVASAEQMNEMDFTDSMKDFNNRRASKGIHVFKMVLSEPEKGYKCAYAIPTSTIYSDYLNWLKIGGKRYFSKAYDCLTYDGTIKKYKTVSTHSWYYKDKFENITPDVKYESETLIFGADDDTPSMTDTIKQASQEITRPIQQSQEPIVNHFKLNTSKGLIELFNTTESQIINRLKQAFPGVKDDVIKKIANNPIYNS